MTQSTQPIGLPPAQPPAPPSRPAIKIEQGASPKPLQLEAALGTHPGMARGYNEDALRGTTPDFPAAAQRGYLFIVADGMGGHNAGEVASNESASRVYQRYYEDGDPEIHRSLENAMRRTNAELFNQAQANPQQHGMGTTMTAAVIKDGRLYVAHVGDSRLYLIRNGQPEQVTQDHSWVEEQVRAGVLTRLQAESHPQRNVITRALATTPDVKVEHYERELQPSDALVLCSDGLNTEVGDAQIASHTTKAASAEDAVKRLIQLANDNGGEDNVSVIVIRLGDGGTPAGAAPLAVPVAAAAKGGRKFPVLLVIAGVVGVLLVAALAILIPRPGRPPAGGTPSVVALVSPSAPAAGVPSATLDVTQEPAPGVQLIGPQVVSTAQPGNSPAEKPSPITNMSGVQPTSTLAPSATPAPTKAPVRPIPTRAPADNAPTRIGLAARRVPAPLLGDPNNSTEAGPLIQFMWSAAGYSLRPSEGYAVMAWKKDDPDNQTKTGLDLPTLFDACEGPFIGLSRQIDFGASVGKAGSGVYLWTAVVVDTRQKDSTGRCVVISDQPAPHQLTYTGSSSGTGGNANPPCVGPGCK